MPVVSTSIKLPEELKARIQRLAELSHRSPHSVMVEALEREISREERMLEFVHEAMRSDNDIEEGGHVYSADDVHTWLKRLAQGVATERPQPCRK
jgi:predicted transcriptional regulator